MAFSGTGACFIINIYSFVLQEHIAENPVQKSHVEHILWIMTSTLSPISGLEMVLLLLTRFSFPQFWNIFSWFDSNEILALSIIIQIPRVDFLCFLINSSSKYEGFPIYMPSHFFWSLKKKSYPISKAWWLRKSHPSSDISYKSIQIIMWTPHTGKYVSRGLETWQQIN